ncbi:MAG: BREX-3 system P-loop-containing protein BrxF [Candidatus Poribacteria bacterium]
MDANIAMLLKKIQSGYYHLGILPVTTEMDEEKIATQIAQLSGGSTLNVGLKLSELLMELPSSQRAVRAPSELQALLPTAPYIVLYHLPILYHPELQLNVFRLLLQLSRNVPIIALLPCRYDDRWLWYAELGHPEYQQHAREDLYIIQAAKDIGRTCCQLVQNL